LIVKIKNQ